MGMAMIYTVDLPENPTVDYSTLTMSQAKALKHWATCLARISVYKAAQARIDELNDWLADDPPSWQW